MTRIILIGFMGSGKSTLGVQLAQRFSIPLIDTDKEIERFEGKSVELIFEEEGEERFRSLEKQMIDILSTIDTDFILSVGGGLPCFNDQMLKLNQMGQTVYLKCSPEMLAERILNDTNVRPLISGLEDRDLLQFIGDKLKEREVYYSQAKYIADEDQSVDAILRLLLPQRS
jgi:shikimate kinase